jgi:carbon-monoxide dehydrogenase small subunit/xanthine dehydrogenase small subunit
VKDVQRTWTVNGEQRSVSFPPLRRLLDVLREDLGLTGSKEGCGEGECGACTVLLDGEPVTACLVAAGQVPDGAEILTVEGLEKTEGGRALQRAYRDKGAAQCGFCIPGMIVASYALLCRTSDVTEDMVCKAHAGNICRCTGYTKIVEAVLDAAEHWPAPHPNPLPRGEGEDGGTAFRRGEGQGWLVRSVEDTELLIPATLTEALEMLADDADRGVPLAGGTDLMVQWESEVQEPPARAVNIKGLPELKGIGEENSALLIGAGVTHAEIGRSALVCKYAPSLAEAAATIGGAQIQALGTIGGNVANASPAGDLAPSLLVAEAVVHVAGARGERSVPMTSFLLGYREIDLAPDELMVRFEVPKLKADEREGWRKLGSRAAQAISKVMGSYRGSTKDGVVESMAVALGSVAPTAVRLISFETWIAGKRIDDALLDEVETRVAEEIDPIDDIRSTAEYRSWVSGRIVREFVQRLSEENHG